VWTRHECAGIVGFERLHDLSRTVLTKAFLDKFLPIATGERLIGKISA